MRIICIEGLWHEETHPVWINLEIAFRREFAPEEFVIERERNLRLRERKRIHEYADRIVETHNDGEELLLVGHSFGGIVACMIAGRFTRSRVLGTATIFSPHRLPSIFVGPRRDRQPLVPIISFGGRRDYVVPRFLTEHPHAGKHILLPVDHWKDIAADIRYAELIANETKEFVFPTA